MKNVLFVVLAMVSNAVAAIPVTLDVGGQDLLTVEFSLPVQPAAHNALLINVSSSSGPASGFQATARLFNGGTELATTVTSFVGERYASSGSFFSGIDPLIDFSQLAGGTGVGLWTLQVTSGSRSFDTDNLFVTPFGDGGSQSGFAGAITRVTVASSTAAVPAPPTASLLLALAFVTARCRRGAARFSG